MTPTDIRFAADGMLQSLATWLRALGYDLCSPAAKFVTGVVLHVDDGASVGF